MSPCPNCGESERDITANTELEVEEDGDGVHLNGRADVYVSCPVCGYEYAQGEAELSDFVYFEHECEDDDEDAEDCEVMEEA